MKVKKFVAGLLCILLCMGMCTTGSLAATQPLVTEGDFIFEIYDTTVYLKQYVGDDADVTIPAKTSTGLVVPYVRPNAFDGADSVVSITVPATVTTIAKDAFTGAENLKSVRFLGNQTNVSLEAFDLDKVMSDPDNVDEYGNVYMGSYLLAINAKDGVSRIRPGTTTVNNEIKYLANPAELYFPESFKYLFPYAFSNASTLKEVHFENSPVYIDRLAFSECTKLKEVYLSAATEYVGYHAFHQYCYKNRAQKLVYGGKVLLKAFSGLETYQIQNGTTLIAHQAFYNIKGQPFTVYVPASVRRICESAFESSYLARIEFAGAPETLDTAVFRHCTKLISLSLPEGIKTLPRHAVGNCVNLRYIELPASLTSIKARAFANTNNLRLVLYRGTEKQFSSIKISNTYNTKLTEAAKLYEFNAAGCKHTIRQNFTILQQSGKAPAVNSQLCMSCGKNLKVFKNKSVRQAADTFKDIHTDVWFYNSVNFAYNYEVFKGVTKDQFAPNQPVTRGMFVTVLMRLSGTEYSNGKPTGYTDVPTGKYYSGAVRWASEMGIVNGIGGGKFAPDDYITREQLCKMVVLYTVYGDVDLYKGETAYYFDDDAAISGWARDFVYICQATGVVNGKENNMFDPQANASRAQVARVLHSLHSKCYTFYK